MFQKKQQQTTRLIHCREAYSEGKKTTPNVIAYARLLTESGRGMQPLRTADWNVNQQSIIPHNQH